MKATAAAFMMATLVMTSQALWIPQWGARSRYEKRRGYRTGFLDPEMMLATGKMYTASEAHRGSIEKFEDLPEIEWYHNTDWVYQSR